MRGAAARTAALLALAAAAVAGTGMAGPAVASTGAATAGASPGGQPRAVMILVDIHASVPTAVAAEHAAVISYANALPPDVRAGLITFSDRWQLVLRPTTNRARLAAAVTAIQPIGSTSDGIYQALPGAEAAVSRLGATVGGRLIVFSDGETLNGGAPTASLPADVVMWHIDADDRLADLRAFAQASHGQVASPAGAAGLAAAFPPLPKAHPRASHAGPSAAAQPPHRRPITVSGTPWILMVGLGTLFAALLVAALAALGVVAAKARDRDLAGQIGRYGPKQAPPADSEHGKVASTALDLVSRAMGSGERERRLAQRLDLAAIARKPAEWVLLGICGSAVLAAVLSVATRAVLIGIVGGALAGWLTMRLIVGFRIARRRAAFSDQLPDLLQLIAGSLKSGFSLPQALDSVVREDAQPAAGEFARALAEARIGADIADGLEAVAGRMDSDDLRWTVMAIRIQRGVGGNLAEVLLTIAGTIRERAYLRRQVRALSAEGRLSGYVLVALPVLVAGWLFISSAEYMRPLYTTSTGLVMLLGAVGLVAVGALWMRSIIKVEV